MPYMQSRGDYLGGGYAGDPGLFGFLGGIAKKIAGFTLGGGIAGAVGRRVITGRAGPVIVNGQMGRQLPPPGSIGGPAGFQQEPQKVGGLRGVGQRLVPGGASGYECPPGTRGYHLAKDGSGRMVRNRTMNVANPRALRRAIRREQGFVKLAQRSLKGTGYKIARR